MYFYCINNRYLYLYRLCKTRYPITWLMVQINTVRYLPSIPKAKSRTPHQLEWPKNQVPPNPFYRLHTQSFFLTKLCLDHPLLSKEVSRTSSYPPIFGRMIVQMTQYTAPASKMAIPTTQCK